MLRCHARVRFAIFGRHLRLQRRRLQRRDLLLLRDFLLRVQRRRLQRRDLRLRQQRARRWIQSDGGFSDGTYGDANNAPDDDGFSDGTYGYDAASNNAPDGGFSDGTFDDG